MNREDCHHKTVYFGSGDYYIFCRDCPARWVACNLTSDQPCPSVSNQGVGGMLSGEVREERRADPTSSGDGK
jgi:hypothetical protein